MAGKGFGGKHYAPMPWWALPVMILIVLGCLAIVHALACATS